MTYVAKKWQNFSRISFWWNMFVEVSRTPGMESQGIAAPCSAQQLRKVAQRCAALRATVNFLFFIFWPNRSCRVSTLWFFSTRNRFPGLFLRLHNPLADFLAILRCFRTKNRSKNGIICSNLELSNRSNISR